MILFCKELIYPVVIGFHVGPLLVLAGGFHHSRASVQQFFLYRLELLQNAGTTLIHQGSNVYIVVPIAPIQWENLLFQGKSPSYQGCCLCLLSSGYYGW